MTIHQTIHQTLHGYRRGHELLASSVSLPRLEDIRVAELSDLSGYLPSRGDGAPPFEVYHTGYPCGRWYAFAATWLDLEAPRSGCVLTHTLLIDKDDLAQMAWPWGLAALHRRPAGASDLGGFDVPLEVDPCEVVPPGVVLADGAPRDLAYDRRLELARAFFALQQRPVLWDSSKGASEVFGWLWWALWPRERVDLSFCTWVVNLRCGLDRATPMHLLGVPAEAQRHLLQQRRGLAVCGAGVGMSEALLRRLARRGREETRRWEAAWRAAGVEAPALGRVGAGGGGLTMDARLEQVFARWCALRVGRWWHYHSTVFKWLGTRGSAAHQSAQWARVAPLSQERAEATVSPWARAGRWAEAAAHWAAAMESTPLEQASGIAASAAAATVRAQCAAWECYRLGDVPSRLWGTGPWDADNVEAAQASERGAQAEVRDRINALSSLLLEHGLEALRTQEAADDPWLTREVWEVVMERDVEVVMPMRDQGETYHVEIAKTVRMVPDYDVVREWYDWMIAAKKSDAAPVPEEAAVGAGEGGGDVAPSP